MIAEAEQDLKNRIDDPMQERVIIQAKTLSMQEQERDNQIYEEMSTLRDENSVLKEQIESLTIQNRVLRTKAHDEKIKLEYFGPVGRADPLRFLLYHAGVDFDDVTITGE